jgi:uncharacterized glyoxalase superfamily protein PhnB
MTAKIYPLLTYHDAKTAIGWLGETFGFEPLSVYEGENGRIEHAELKLGDGIIMLSSKSDDIWSIASGPIAVSLPDGIDDHYERARAVGALIEREPFDTHYGSLDYAARDLEGNLWSFGTYMPE